MFEKILQLIVIKIIADIEVLLADMEYGDELSVIQKSGMDSKNKPIWHKVRTKQLLLSVLKGL